MAEDTGYGIFGSNDLRVEVASSKETLIASIHSSRLPFYVSTS